ncbi:MAG: hypothetical protein AB7U78_09400, partial [Hyphomicrobiaceae bacterium]
PARRQLWTCFDPRARAGAPDLLPVHRPLGVVSNHAPVRARRHHIAGEDTTIDVSIHAPVRARRFMVCNPD